MGTGEVTITKTKTEHVNAKRNGPGDRRVRSIGASKKIYQEGSLLPESVGHTELCD